MIRLADTLALWRSGPDVPRLASAFLSDRLRHVGGAAVSDRADLATALRESYRLYAAHVENTEALAEIGCLTPDTLAVSPAARKLSVAADAERLLADYEGLAGRCVLIAVAVGREGGHPALGRAA